LFVLPDNRTLWAVIHGNTAEAALVEEDRTGVAVVMDSPRAEVPGAQALYVGGRWQSQMNPYSPVQGVLGLLASLVHPDPRSILVIGYGGGGSVWATTANPMTEKIDVVEIVEPVIGVVHDYVVAREGAVPDAMSDDRVKLTIADGRHHMMVNPDTYDVIVAEAVTPESAHSGLLFSIEFFRQVRDRLEPGGIVVQWAPTQRVINTFRQAFPYIVRTNNALIGSLEPLDFSLRAFAARLRREAQPHLAAGGWQVEDVMA
jgi:spermidine synthase